MISQVTSNKIRNMALVCACFVVVIHTSSLNVDKGSCLWWTRVLLGNGVCRLAMPFFFFVSGFFLARHMNEGGWYGREVIKRIKTLLMPYFVFCILGVVWTCLVSNRFDASVSNCFRAFGLHPLVSPICGQLWYIRSITILVLAAPLIKYVVERKWLFGVVLICCVLLDVLCNNDLGKYALYHYFSFMGPIWFWIGVFVSLKKKDIGCIECRFNMSALVLGGGGFSASDGGLRRGMT